MTLRCCHEVRPKLTLPQGWYILRPRVLPTRTQKCRVRHTACSHKSVHPASLDFMGGGACHEALQHDAPLSEADKGVEGEVTHKLDGKTTRHSIRATAATAFIGTTAAAAAVFCPHSAFEHLRLPASCCQPAPGYASTTSWPLPAAISAPWAKSRRHVKSWFGATPWRRATKRTVPGSNVSSTIRTFSDAVQRRRRLTDVKISTRSAGLVIDTGCMPLAKWETGSGRFGGYLIKIAKLGRSRPGIQPTSPLFDDLYQI